MAQLAQTVSTRFSTDTVNRLDEIAKNQDRSRSDIIHEAVNGYLNSIAWLAAEIKKADEDFAAGHFISHEEIKKKYGVVDDED